MDDPGEMRGEVLHQVLCGERDLADPEVLRWFDSPAEAAAALAEARALLEELDAEAAEAAKDLTEVASQPTTQRHLRLVNSFLRTMVEGETAPQVSPPPTVTRRTHRPARTLLRPALLVGAAALCLLAVGRIALRWEEALPRTRVVLSAGGAIEPAGEVAAVTTFTWTYALPVDGYFRVRVLEPGVELTETVVLEKQLETNRWDLSSAERELLPGRLILEVIPFDENGRPRPGGRQEVWRRR